MTNVYGLINFETFDSVANDNFKKKTLNSPIRVSRLEGLTNRKKKRLENLETNDQRTALFLDHP